MYEEIQVKMLHLDIVNWHSVSHYVSMLYMVRNEYYVVTLTHRNFYKLTRSDNNWTADSKPVRWVYVAFVAGRAFLPGGTTPTELLFSIIAYLRAA